MKIGISGIGYWGRKVLTEYIKLEEEGYIDGIFIYDVSERVPPDIVQRGGISIAESYSDLLDSVDAVHICTPNNIHREQIFLAFERSRDVLVEKPVTEDSNSAFRAVEESLAKGLIFQVGNIFRFSNSLREVRKMLEGYEYGKVNHVSVHWSHIAKSISSSNEDIVWDLMPHILDILNFLFSEWPEYINCVSSNPTSSETGVKHTDLLLSYKKGFECNVYMSHIDHRTHRDIEISCDKATIFVNPVTQDINITERGSERRLAIDANNTLREEILNFIDAHHQRKNKTNSAFIGAVIVKEIEKIKEAVRD